MEGHFSYQNLIPKFGEQILVEKVAIQIKCALG